MLLVALANFVHKIMEFVSERIAEILFATEANTDINIYWLTLSKVRGKKQKNILMKQIQIVSCGPITLKSQCRAKLIVPLF
jgi:hypothetical protein